MSSDDPESRWVEPPLDIYFTRSFENMARERLAGWSDWEKIKDLLEWMFSHRFYAPSMSSASEDRYWITFNLTDQVHRVSTWVFEYEQNDIRTRQADAIDLYRKLP